MAQLKYLWMAKAILCDIQTNQKCVFPLTYPCYGNQAIKWSFFLKKKLSIHKDNNLVKTL